MSRPPLGCMTCVTIGASPGAYWTTDKNWVRWDIYMQPSSLDWSAYTSQYGSPPVLLTASSESELWVQIASFAASHAAVSPVPIGEVSMDAPFKAIPSSPTYGPPSPPAGWIPPSTPTAPPPSKPVLSSVPEAVLGAEKDNTGTYVMLGVGAIAVALMVGTLKVK